VVDVRSKRCLGRTEADRKIAKRAMVVDAAGKETNEGNAQRSGTEKCAQKILTGPTLLEMSGRVEDP